MMLVSMYDVQACKCIYAVTSGIMTQAAWPVTGEAVCASRPVKDSIFCGTVTDDWRSWISETANYTVWGGDTDIGSDYGDSGSPIYRRVYAEGVWQNIPVGILTHQNGYFSRVKDALSAWGLAIWA
ncbi:MAG: S1 family peptidase [Actinomycetota bacterium]|nr:S1 family peptidase [Actinomycetota bacterium]